MKIDTKTAAEIAKAFYPEIAEYIAKHNTEFLQWLESEKENNLDRKSKDNGTN